MYKTLFWVSGVGWGIILGEWGWVGIVCTPPPPLSAGGRVEPPTRFLKRGDLTGLQFLEEVAGNKGGGLFLGGLQSFDKR